MLVGGLFGEVEVLVRGVLKGKGAVSVHKRRACSVCAALPAGSE